MSTEKPKIYLFHNSTRGGLYCGLAMAEDGTVLGHHASSTLNWMIDDLAGKEKEFEAHYPAGYALHYVSREDVPTHAALQEAFRLDDMRQAATKDPL